MARAFNGTTDKALTPTITWNALPAGHSFAVSFWLNWTAYAADDKRAVFINNSGAGGSWDSDPNSSIGGAVHLFGMRNPGGISWIDEFPRPSAGVWHHYLLISTRPPSGPQNWAYVDGVAQTLTTGNHSAGMGTTTGTGAVNFMASSGFAAGSLAEWAVWQSNLIFAGSSQLHSAQALAAGASPLTVNQGQLLAYYPFGLDPGEPECSTRCLVTGQGPLTLTGTTVVNHPRCQSMLMGLSGG